MVERFPYACARDKLGVLAEKFEPLSPDAETQAWLARHEQAAHGVLRRGLVELLSTFMSLYDAHGLTGSYPMHLLSTTQLRSLVGEGHARLLDVGAGAGYVTQYAEKLTREVVCTETSRRLAQRLVQRGFRVHVQDLGETRLPDGAPFDVILCLNVLDRTSHPRRLLSALRSLCAPATKLVVAVPLPIHATVFVKGGSIAPSEALPCAKREFETAALELSTQLFMELGFEIVRFARVPYFSVGDSERDLYVLDDGIWVLRAA